MAPHDGSQFHGIVRALALVGTAIALAVLLLGLVAPTDAQWRESPARPLLAALPGPVASNLVVESASASESCFGKTCGDKDPEAMGCSGDAVTIKDSSYGGHSWELRYSKKCHAFWLRVKKTTTDPGFGHAVAYNKAGKTVWIESVPLVAGRSWTRMISARFWDGQICTGPKRGEGPFDACTKKVRLPAAPNTSPPSKTVREQLIAKYGKEVEIGCGDGQKYTVAVVVDFTPPETYNQANGVIWRVEPTGPARRVTSIGIGKHAAPGWDEVAQCIRSFDPLILKHEASKASSGMFDQYRCHMEWDGPGRWAGSHWDLESWRPANKSYSAYKCNW